mgnify:CR=1 FL=1
MVSLYLWRNFLLSLSLSLVNASILQRIKEAYLLWVSILDHVPKGQRHSIGARIENKFLDLLELSYIAYFIEKDKKIERINQCILDLDAIKFLIHITWEGKLISHKQYAEIGEKLKEIGKMFGGWRKNLENPEKKNLAR